MGVHLLLSSTQCCFYCPQSSGRSARGNAVGWRRMKRWPSGREWKTQSRRDTLIMWWPWDDAHKWNLSHDVVCNHDDKNLSTGLCAHGITLAITCWCSCALCGKCSGSWCSRCHWCRARFHHTDAIPSVEFFPSEFCSPLMHLLSLFSMFVNFICSQIFAHFPIAKTGHLRCSLYTSRRLQ